MIRALVLAGTCVTALAISADAHKPLAIGLTFPSQTEALRVEDLDVSQVAYVELTAAQPEFWMTFDAAGPFDLYLQLGIPVLDRLEEYRPRVSVISQSTGEEIASFDSALAGQPRFFHEPFTGTDSWILLEESVPIAAAGTYFIVATAPPGEADKLWVAVGQREAFGLSDVLSLSSVIRAVRAFHEVGPRGPTSLEWATLLGFVVLGFILVLAAIESMS